MINLLNIWVVKQPIYKVYRSVINLPARVLCEKFTECTFSKYAIKGPDEYGMIDFECEIKGFDFYGNYVTVCSFDGRVRVDSEDLIKPQFFLTLDEALKEADKIKIEIENDKIAFSQKCIKELSKSTIYKLYG